MFPFCRRPFVRPLLFLAAALPVRVSAQAVLLQIRPRAGDTVHMRLDQQSEMTGSRRPVSGRAEATSSVITNLRMFSRAVVETTTTAGSTVLAITDSVAMNSTDVHARAMADETRRMLERKRVLLRLGTDGVVSMAEHGVDDGADEGLSNAMSLMPAAFPRAAVRVGETWTRDMPLPAGDRWGRRAAGQLHAVFRLDSLTRGGDRAWVSMKGEIRPMDSSDGAPTGGPVLRDGNVYGSLLLDRRRGWLSESHFVIVVHSEVLPPPSSGLPPMRFQMKITQHTRTLDNR